jgi:hypothetical protein
MQTAAATIIQYIQLYNLKVHPVTGYNSSHYTRKHEQGFSLQHTWGPFGTASPAASAAVLGEAVPKTIPKQLQP